MMLGGRRNNSIKLNDIFCLLIQPTEIGGCCVVEDPGTSVYSFVLFPVSWNLCFFSLMQMPFSHPLKLYAPATDVL